jgi:hypothetical protein
MCCFDWLSAHGTLQAHDPHQPRHGAAGYIVAFPAQLVPDLPHPVDPVVLLEHAVDHHLKIDIAPQPRRGFRRISPACRSSKVGRRGDRQNSADRLDPVGRALIVNEGDHGLNRRSNSA